MQTNNPCELLTATMPVGSGDLLGIGYLLMTGFIIVLVGLLRILWMLHKVIRQYEQTRSQNHQNPSKLKKSAGETDERVCLPLQLLGRLRLLLGNNGVNRRHHGMLVSITYSAALVAVHFLYKLLDSLFWKITHKAKKRTMPNE
jgi:hypothetical protein